MKRFALALGLLAAPSMLAGQVWSYTDYCATGTGTACLSSRISTQWTGTETVATIYIQNNDVAMDLTDGYRISGIGLTAPELEGVSGVAMGTEDGAESYNNAAGEWEESLNGTGNTTLYLETGTANVAGGIEGCLGSNARSDPSLDSFFRTCAGGVNTGWVTFSFTTSNEWAATDAELAYRFMSGGDSEDDWSMNCPSGEFGCNVVPEPMTVALLATGLLGVGGVAFIRRRREDDLIE